MNKIIKRLSAILLSLAMVIAMMPQVAFADGKGQLKSISFAPVSSYYLYENNQGWWEENDGDPFFYYYEPEFVEGDTLILHYEKVDVNYTYVVDEQGNSWFESSSGETLDFIPNKKGERISTYGAQYENHWKAGDNNYFTITYSDGNDYWTTPGIRFTILENPVVKVEYKRAKDLVYVEKTNGRIENDEITGDEFYYYDGLEYQDGDIATITYKDESRGTVSYTYDEEKEEFRSKDGDVLEKDWHYIDMNSDQWKKHWHVGTDNEYYFEYFGHRATLFATVVANDVVGIEYYPIKDIIYKEYDESHGCWFTDHDDNPFFYYYLGDYEEGDRIVLKHSNGSSENYTYQYNYIDEGYDFISNDGKVLGYIETYTDNDVFAPGNNWGIGEHFYTMYYQGAKTKVKVEIVANPDAPTTTKPSETTTKVKETTTKVKETTPKAEETTKSNETNSNDITPTTTNNSKTSIKKLYAKKKSLKVIWNRVSGVNGYQLQAALKKNFKKAKTVTVNGANKTSTTIKKLKAKKKYFVRIRTFINSNGKKVFSPWSGAKKKKTK